MMGKRNRKMKYSEGSLNDLNRGVQKLVENSGQINEKMDDIAVEVVKGNRTKPLEIAGFLVAVLAVIVTIVGIKFSDGKSTEASSSDVADMDTEKPVYEIYLYPDYSRVEVGFQTDITATLNFDTDSVSIDAYLDSVHNGDTVVMKQKNSSEWQAKVYFEETGTYEIVATATASDGSIVKGTVEVEVVP